MLIQMIKEDIEIAKTKLLEMRVIVARECPIAQALKRMGYEDVMVAKKVLYVSKHHAVEGKEYWLPKEAEDFITNFDHGFPVPESLTFIVEEVPA